MSLRRREIRAAVIVAVPKHQDVLPSLFLACSIDAKRKIDGEAANSRYSGEEIVSTHWLNERFRQTMQLIREFRLNWNAEAMISHDDIQFLRVCLDVALHQASQEGHKGDLYDVNPTLWAIWLIQHLHAVRAGGWTVERVSDQLLWSTSGMYAFLRDRSALGEWFLIKDPATKELLHRYKLPFRTQNVPPRSNKVFIWKKAIRRLSDWMVAGGLAPIDEAILNLQPPAIVAPLPAAAAREARREALWARVAQRANQRPLLSVGGDDAEETRQLISGVLNESREAAGGSGEGLSDEQADEIEAELEREMGEASSSSGDPASASTAGPSAPPRRLLTMEQMLEFLMRDDGNTTSGTPPQPPGAGEAGSSATPQQPPGGGGMGSSTAPQQQPGGGVGENTNEISEYEVQRLRNIEVQNRWLREHGLGQGEGLPRPRPRAPRDPFPPGRSGADPSRRSTRQRKTKVSDAELVEDRGSSAEDSDGD